MTGFARSSGQADGVTWSWEVKSVNGRGLDIRLRLPSGTESFESAIRDALGKKFARGNFNVVFTYAQTDTASAFTVNGDLLDKLVDAAKSYGDGQVDISALLNVRGVVETVSSDVADLPPEPLIEGFHAALESMAESRAREGAQLQSVLSDILDDIEALVEQAGRCAATRPAAVRQRMQTQIAEILNGAPAVPEERLAQELAILATKADIREELDRLTAHISTARALLAAGEPVGRRLDFLCQEFNREANTLCSKSGDVELTNIGLALKAAVDQMREQVQNVE